MLHLFKADVLSVSRSLAHYLVVQARLSPMRVRTIYCGVELPGSGRQPCSSPCSVSIVGSVEERKGHEFLLRALALLSQKHPNLTAVFIGHCDESERLRLIAIAEGLEVNQRLVWRPHVDSTDSAFAGVEILVVPSVRQESFGRVAAEAMARGIPVIASDCGGLPEVVEDEISGIVVPRGDAQSLADGLDRILNDTSLRQRFAVEGVARVTAMFSAAEMAREYSRLLHND